MKTSQKLAPLLLTAALGLGGNLLKSPSVPLLADYPKANIAAGADLRGIFIIDKKWIFPRPSYAPQANGSAYEILSMYGQ